MTNPPPEADRKLLNSFTRSADQQRVTEAAPAESTPTWVCVACRSHMPMAADVCSQCGRAFGEGLSLDGAKPEDRRTTNQRLRTTAIAVKELVIVNLLFIVWRIVGAHSVLHSSGAYSRGRDVWRFERWLHLPSEVSVQRGVLAHHWLTHSLDLFYAWAHVLALVLFLVWLFWRHRDQYAQWRNFIVGFTFVALLIGWLPVAPPRLLPGLGFVDTAMRDHTSVYAGIGKHVTDQLSAMPSVHVGWAVLIAFGVIKVSTSRWRWLIVAHPLVTWWTVVATANHFWLDGVAAILLLVLVFSAGRLPLLRQVQLPRSFRQRPAEGRIDREGVSELVDSQVVLHSQ